MLPRSQEDKHIILTMSNIRNIPIQYLRLMTGTVKQPCQLTDLYRRMPQSHLKPPSENLLKRMLIILNLEMITTTSNQQFGKPQLNISFHHASRSTFVCVCMYYVNL